MSLSLYAVVGAAAFLSGCVRYKSTAIIIAMESTGAWFLIVPIAIAGGCTLPQSPPSASHGPAYQQHWSDDSSVVSGGGSCTSCCRRCLSEFFLSLQSYRPWSPEMQGQQHQSGLA